MKIIRLQIFIMVLVFLMGCSNTKFEIESGQQLFATSEHSYYDDESTIIANQETDEDNNKLFELKVFSDKNVYKTTDKIDIWATLKYIGSQNQIEIWHGKPYINFEISDGKEFYIGGLRLDVLTSTILEKDEIYKFDYYKNGGYSEDDPKADFWKKFYSEKDLYLPEGEYTITAIGDFYLTKDIKQNESNLSSEIKIKVIE